ncbi:MAG TPA: hypothetical protein EYN69_11475 [Flavobacteriales bacterium]|nr:hypothetical protein [Flavobacteriales bacterium]
MKQILSFDFEHGHVEGAYWGAASENAPLLVITNGHNGFYSYGMFPYIQEKLGAAGISSFSYNFSHGGVIGNSDYFEDLKSYEKNCMRLEQLDLVQVVRALKEAPIGFTQHTELFLFAHSLGGVPTVFGAQQLTEDGMPPTGIALVSTMKTLNFYPPAMIQEWEQCKVLLRKNNRTGQELPQGNEFLQEILSSDTSWNVKNALGKIKSKVLLVHGEDDEAIPVLHSKALHQWALEYELHSTLHIIPGATHTYNTKHPFEGPSNEVDELIETLANWIL